METMKMETAKQKNTLQFVLQVYLPEDMIMEILSWLPARSVGQLRCISKSWLSISTSRSFIRSQSQRSTTHKSIIIEGLFRIDFHFASFNNAVITLHDPTPKRPNKTIVEASWEGFLLLYNIKTQHHSLFNPITCQSINLPNSYCESTLFLCLYLHRSTSKYRLLKLLSDDDDVHGTEVLVVGESYWRRIPGNLPAFHHHPHPVEFNGRLHWLSTTQRNMFKPRPKRNIFKPPLSRNFQSIPNTIMTFDTETEIYNLLPLPPINLTSNLGGNLIDFNGELGLWNIGRHFLDLWIMERSSLNWVKRYSVDCQKNPEVRRILFQIVLKDPWMIGVAITVRDEELLIDVSATMGDSYLLWVNLKHGTSGVGCWGNCRQQNLSFPYMESLTHIKCYSSSTSLQTLPRPEPRHEWLLPILSGGMLVSISFLMLWVILSYIN